MQENASTERIFEQGASLTLVNALLVVGAGLVPALV